jgi:hypothetical protein
MSLNFFSPTPFREISPVHILFFFLFFIFFPGRLTLPGTLPPLIAICGVARDFHLASIAKLLWWHCGGASKVPVIRKW